jgi:uncharacterized repeat protein (TIGR03803 family)
MRSQKPFPTANMVFPIFLTLLLASIVVAAQTQATKFNVLHTFHGADGGSPMGVLVRDAAGNIYGTTVGGGTGKCSKLGCGTAFKLNRSGQQVWVHSFGGGDGYGPDAGLLRDAAGNLFGTTLDGGKVTKTCGGAQAGGCGVVFRLDRNGNETVLYKFKGTPDGDSPEALLVEDKAGNLYGTTYEGGAEGLGAVLKIDTNGKEIILHSFAGPPDGGGDGALSYQGVIRDAAGDLYGVTAGGGVYGAGVVYKVAGGKETLLYSFTGGSDGGGPNSVLLADVNGNLYGTTQNGGSSTVCDGGCGTVFRLSPDGGSWTETVLYSFCSVDGCVDGERPIAGPLVRDSAGNLYGTTYFGGTNDDGVVFKLDASGKETVLHSFTGGADGEFPYAGLVRDSSGNLYGTTQAGGARCYTSYTCGVVFKITP